MKKILGIISLFLGIELVVCIIAGFVTKIQVEIPSSSVFLYKFCTVFEYFFKYLPYIILTGFTASCSVYFGHNAEGSIKRFSNAMFKRFKSVMIASLICTAFLTLTQEVFTVAIKKSKEQIVNRPKIIKEYIKVGNNLFNEGLYDRAQKYALATLQLEPNSQEARDLKGKAELEINRIEFEDLRFDLANAKPLEEEDNSLKIDQNAMLQVKECLTKAEDAFTNGQWFYAHYYSELGKKLVSAKDPNYDRLQELSIQSWTNLESDHQIEKTKEQNQYDEKYEGYKALMNKDDLQAYYIFRSLLEDPEMKHDSDVLFYYEIARERIEQKYFFIDETFELQSFENASDVYFSHTHLSGSKDIVYFKGMTEVKETGQTIQYLRDLTIMNFDYQGNWIKTMHCPYAKMMPVSVKNINSITKKLLEIDDSTEYVPYLLLKSIGRDDSKQVYTPDFSYNDNEEHLENDYLLFPMAFDDFLMLENSTINPETAYAPSLIKFVSNAERFGYSQSVFGQIVLNRILYPLFLLILFIFLAAFGWNNRLGSDQFFKFSWLFSFPLIILIEYVFYSVMMFQYRLINYALIGMTGSLSALAAGSVVYTVLLLLVSIYFLARKA